jgi:hypothetical protein
VACAAGGRLSGGAGAGGIVGADRGGDDDGDPGHGCGSQRYQAEHDAVGRERAAQQ